MKIMYFKKVMTHFLIIIMLIFVFDKISAKSNNVFDKNPAILLNSIPLRKTDTPLVFVHYMAWFESKGYTGKWGGHWTMKNCNPDILLNNEKRQIASHYYPIIGPYDSADPDLLEYHVLLMKLSGIDGVLIDWPGLIEHFDWAKIKDNSERLISYIKKAGLKFGVVYEDVTLKHALKDRIINNMIKSAQETMIYLKTKYFSKDYYIWINGKPLLLIWGPRAVLSNNEWQKILTVFNKRNPYLIFLRGHTAYNNLYKVSDGEYSWLPPKIEKSLIKFYKTAQKKKYKVIIGSVFQGYHDYYKEGDWGKSLNYIPHNNGQTFLDTLKLANKWKPDAVQIPTWNDFGEGTIIEPTLEFGYKYLSYIQKFTAVNYDVTDLKLVTKIYFLRKQNKHNTYIQKILDESFSLIVSGNIKLAHKKLEKLKLDFIKKEGDIITSSDIIKIHASSEVCENKAEYIFDKNIKTRWESRHGVDPVWIQFTFKKKFKIFSININWEIASAERYKVQVSNNGIDWQTVKSINNGKKDEDRTISFKPVKIKCLRLYCEKRTTEWSYSIWELEFNVGSL